METVDGFARSPLSESRFFGSVFLIVVSSPIALAVIFWPKLADSLVFTVIAGAVVLGAIAFWMWRSRWFGGPPEEMADRTGPDG